MCRDRLSARTIAWPRWGELCRQHTSLTRDEINHLKQLVSEWGLLADLCFADSLALRSVDRFRVADRRPGAAGDRTDDLPQ